MIVFTVLAIFLVIAAPAAIDRWLVRLLPNWSPAVLVLAAAAPLAILLAAPGLWIFATSAIGIAPLLGSGNTDGYREMFAAFALIGAVLAYAIGLISATIALTAQQ